MRSVLLLALRPLIVSTLATIPFAALAESPRDTLTRIAFTQIDKPTTLALIERVRASAALTLRQSPGDREAQLLDAMAIGYRAKLTRSRSDAVSARDAFTALVARNPKDAEAQAALGSWHVTSVASLGSFAAGMVLGARAGKGYAALDRAIASGGNRAMFVGLAALLRLKLDGPDPEVKRLAALASAAPAPTALDQLMRRDAVAVLASLQAGNASASRALATRMLPLGRFD